MFSEAEEDIAKAADAEASDRRRERGEEGERGDGVEKSGVGGDDDGKQMATRGELRGALDAATAEETVKRPPRAGRERATAIAEGMRRIIEKEKIFRRFVTSERMFWNREKNKEGAEAFDGVGTLAVIIPALNEEDNISSAVRSALDDGSGGEKEAARERRKNRRFRDRGRDRDVFVVVVDGGSSDATVAAARRAGAHRVLRCPTRGRGAQLAAGVAAVSAAAAAASSSSSSSDSFFLPPPRRRRGNAKPDTLLFLHADSRLPPDYRESISRALTTTSAAPSSYSSWGAFETVAPTGLAPAASLLLSACVSLRTRLCGLPYGDQGIFVSSELLHKIGGVRPLPLMEDVDLVERLSLAGRRESESERKERENSSSGRKVNSRPAVARGAVETSGRRWAERGLVRTTLLNLWTLARWKSGAASAEELAREYYSRKKV